MVGWLYDGQLRLLVGFVRETVLHAAPAGPWRTGASLAAERMFMRGLRRAISSTGLVSFSKNVCTAARAIASVVPLGLRRRARQSVPPVMPYADAGERPQRRSGVSVALLALRCERLCMMTLFMYNLAMHDLPPGCSLRSLSGTQGQGLASSVAAWPATWYGRPDGARTDRKKIKPLQGANDTTTHLRLDNTQRVLSQVASTQLPRAPNTSARIKNNI